MFKLNKTIKVRHKGWHAEGNSAAKPVLMCDGKQFRSLTIWPHRTTQDPGCFGCFKRRPFVAVPFAMLY
jgi:hypothetical protein